MLALPEELLQAVARASGPAHLRLTSKQAYRRLPWQLPGDEDDGDGDGGNWAGWVAHRRLPLPPGVQHLTLDAGETRSQVGPTSAR